jgi:hypothetical protein
VPNLLLKAQGHYQGSSFNPNDFFIPPVSGWVFLFFTVIPTWTISTRMAKKTDLIEISQNPPFSVEISQEVTTHSVIPMALYFGKGKILHANWGFLALPLINSPSANVALDFYTGLDSAINQDININSFGLGDFYVQPVWLTWEKNKVTTAFSYGLWLPTGKYRANDSENIGLGYISQNIRLATRYKPNTKYSLTGAITLESNFKQKDVDFTEAPHLTFDYGITYYFLKGHEAGVLGHGTWQLGNDQGEKAVLNKDHVYGLGAYVSYWFIPGKFGILSRASHNFITSNRFSGFSFVVGLNYLLFKAG